MAAASIYEYTPYSSPKPPLPKNELIPPTDDDFENLVDNSPIKTIQFTILAPVVEIWLMDHPYFKATKGMFFSKRKV